MSAFYCSRLKWPEFRKALLLNALQRPRQWPQFSLNLAKAMAGNGTALANSILPSYSQSFDSPDLTRLAVTCLDSPPPANETDYPTAEELADVGLDALEHVSKRFGVSATLSEPDGGCQFWPARGLERFTGPWNHTLKNPMLIVSNTASLPTASRRWLANLKIEWSVSLLMLQLFRFWQSLRY